MAMAKYSKVRSDLEITEGADFKLVLRGRLDANLELPTSASEVRADFTVAGEPTKTTLDDYGLTGQQLTNQREIVNAVLENVTLVKRGMVKDPP